MTIPAQKLPDSLIEIGLEYAFKSNLELDKQRELARKIANLKPALYVEEELNYLRVIEECDTKDRISHLARLEDLARRRFETAIDIADLCIGRKFTKNYTDPRLSGVAYLD